MTTDDTPFVEATYRALCAHGFADLTMQDIADETDRSKAALHYHYDGKDDLFRAFLEYLYGEFTETTADPPGETPAERLIGFVRAVLSTDERDGEQFTTAYLEIKAQAPYREGFREQLRRFDDHVRERVEELVAAGIEAGQFPPETEPAEVAAFVTTYFHGTWTRSVAAGGDVRRMRERLVEYVCQLAIDDTLDTAVGLPDDESCAVSATDEPGLSTRRDTSAETTADTPAETTAKTPAETTADTPAETTAKTPADTLADAQADTSADTRPTSEPGDREPASDDAGDGEVAE